MLEVWKFFDSKGGSGCSKKDGFYKAMLAAVALATLFGIFFTRRMKKKNNGSLSATFSPVHH